MNKLFFKSKNPVLITGCYRSGTEYFTLLLNNHPTLSASMYTTNFMRYYYKREKYMPLEKKYTSLIDDAYNTIKLRHGIEIEKEYIKTYIMSGPITFARIYDAIMSSIYLKDGKTRWAEKIQLVWRQIPEFLWDFHGSKVIVIIRDPRSVLASFKKHTYAPDPLYLGAIFNCFDLMSYALIYETMFPERFKVVKFEDLLENTEEVMTDVFDFLGLCHDHDITSTKGWKNTDGSPWVHNSSFTKEGEKYDKSKAFTRWKDYLEDWEISMCEEVAGEYMRLHGYDMTGEETPWRDKIDDPTVERYIDEWERGFGIEEFPTDPLDPKNWSENR